MMKKQLIDNIPSITGPGFDSVIPTFLLKLLNLLQEPEFQNHASWNEDGTSFIVHDQANFAKHVLPKYFKHNKFASFVRQLNMYGFRKVTTITQGSLTTSQEAIEFHHPFFIRDNKSLLPGIKRKVTQANNKHTPDDASQILDEVNDIKDSQLNISSRLSNMKRENEDLWREVVSLRQKHAHQQKVVNHLIKFLLSLVHHHGAGVKRRTPLMISDGSGSSKSKVARSDEATHVDTSLPSLSSDENKDRTQGLMITEMLSKKYADPVASVNIKLPILAKSLDDQRTIDTENTAFDISDLMQLSIPVPEESSLMLSKINLKSNNSVSNNASSSTTIAIPDHLYTNTYFSSAPEEDQVDPDLMDDSINTSINTGAPTNQQLAISSPQLYNQHNLENINVSVDEIQDNLQNIQQRLSKNQQIHSDNDRIGELFNNSVDITLFPDFLNSGSSTLNDTAFKSKPIGNEIVQYNGSDASLNYETEPDQYSHLELELFK